MKPVSSHLLGHCDLIDADATRSAAAALAVRARLGDVFALHGDLGAGKTTFARGFIAALSPQTESVPSPTFTLVQIYPAEPGDIWHFDLYRLKQADEAYELGIEEAFASGVSLIEWPDRLGGLLPRQRLDVTLCPGDTPESRRLSLNGSADWATRLAGLPGLVPG